VTVAIEIGDQQFEVPQRSRRLLYIIDRVVDRVLADDNCGAHLHVHLVDRVPIDEHTAEHQNQDQHQADRYDQPQA
jgi:hypothetical protein